MLLRRIATRASRCPCDNPRRPTTPPADRRAAAPWCRGGRGRWRSAATRAARSACPRWCGVYGLKPTHGLVPYTGILPIEVTIDHCGPMANSVEDVARLLSVIAGPDGLDPRQIGTRTNRLLKASGEACAG